MLKVIIVALLLGGLYYIHCRLYPWRKCWRCRGRGKVNPVTNRNKTWAVCPRCRGKRRIRRLLAGRRNQRR